MHTNQKMNFDNPASTWMIWPMACCDLDFDLQNLIRSSVGATGYSLSVLSKLFKVFTGYHGNNNCLDERKNAADGEASNGYHKSKIVKLCQTPLPVSKYHQCFHHVSTRHTGQQTL